MLIRNIDRTLLPRTLADIRGKDSNPMRKTAEGLGTFLDKLSESVRESRSRAETEHSDTVDSGIKAHSRSPMRTFKWPAAEEDGSAAPAAPAVEFALNDAQNQTVEKLREARDMASDASSIMMANEERAALQERVKQLFLEISAERVNTLSSMLDGNNNAAGTPFSVMTPEAARTSYSAIDKMIMRFLEIETESGLDNASSGHEAALSATEQLKEFLINEGPAKAFARFREINRDNVLGLIQQ